jgi:D-tyrosyl-tRNA(Tyr) deacylase
MKALIQRVSMASVAIGGQEVASIGGGLVVMVGIAAGDSQDDIGYLVSKIANLRIFADEAGKFNLSTLDIKAELLLVSQFTLLADTRKGRRPSFIGAATPDRAKPIFEEFVSQVRASGLHVQTGSFQQHMQVVIHNDGPVTIMLDSRVR